MNFCACSPEAITHDAIPGKKKKKRKLYLVAETAAARAAAETAAAGCTAQPGAEGETLPSLARALGPFFPSKSLLQQTALHSVPFHAQKVLQARQPADTTFFLEEAASLLRNAWTPSCGSSTFTLQINKARGAAGAPPQRRVAGQWGPSPPSPPSKQNAACRGHRTEL